MNLKRILVANLVVSSVALATGGVALGITYFDTDKVESVICQCACPGEEVEITEPVEVTDPTEPTEQIESTEPVETVEPTEVTEPTESIEPINLGEFRLTAYCPCEECNGQWKDGITSTGVIAEAGKTIAVDPTVIPYGTEVIINGNTYIAEDCGGAITGNRIDIYFDTHEEALAFGVQYADVYIVRS